MRTFGETEALLRTAILLSETKMKDIAVDCGIKPNTLYKWKTTSVHLSPQKADTLLLYFIEKEPGTLMTALALNYVLLKLYLYLTSSTNLGSMTKEE